MQQKEQIKETVNNNKFPFYTNFLSINLTLMMELTDLLDGVFGEKKHSINHEIKTET